MHSHPILVKVYLFNKKKDKEGNGGGKTKEGNGENSKDQKGGEKTNDADYKMAKLTKYDNSANHLVIYTRHVIEHGMDPAQLEVIHSIFYLFFFLNLNLNPNRTLNFLER